MSKEIKIGLGMIGVLLVLLALVAARRATRPGDQDALAEAAPHAAESPAEQAPRRRRTLLAAPLESSIPEGAPAQHSLWQEDAAQEGPAGNRPWGDDAASADRPAASFLPDRQEIPFNSPESDPPLVETEAEASEAAVGADQEFAAHDEVAETAAAPPVQASSSRFVPLSEREEPNLLDVAETELGIVEEADLAAAEGEAEAEQESLYRWRANDPDEPLAGEADVEEAEEVEADSRVDAVEALNQPTASNRFVPPPAVAEEPQPAAAEQASPVREYPDPFRARRARGAAAAAGPTWQPTEGAPVVASRSALAPPELAADEYMAQPGEDFWALTERALGDGAWFHAVFEHNRDRYRRPDDLRPGDVVQAPPVEKLQQLYPDLAPQVQRRDRPVQTTPAEYQAGDYYVIRSGDSLFDIARQELGSATRWVEIYELNRELLGEGLDGLPVGVELLLPTDEVAVQPTSPRR